MKEDYLDSVRVFQVIVIGIVIFSLAFVSGCVQEEETRELEKSEHMFVETLDVEDKSDLEEVDSVYSLNEQIYTYLDVNGFKISENDKINWKAYVTVYGPDDQVIPGLDDLPLDDGETQVAGDKDWGNVWITSNIWPSEEGWKPGEHTIEYRIVDEIGEKEKTFTETFTAEAEGLYFEEKITPEEEGININEEGTVEESVKSNIRIQELEYETKQGTLKTTITFEGEIPDVQNLENDENILYSLGIDTNADQESDYSMGYYLFGNLSQAEFMVSEGQTYLDNPDASYQVESNTLKMSINLSELNNPEEITLRTLSYYESETGTAVMNVPWETYN
ncbi:MAG: hypothetical protein BTN85_2142 [Candidatus Methanohalarchaeum thermophilum]|uniref:Uncharacterized protein n=1 Tax=Methanohalarchaeum thermophilum TaxID=1903181 RepID=A0A1Q6DT28_METT1|nr:MAG: hypothetical protein BTN85_2142 [Candidatus Methanohalarchaeum thermophilum]